MKNSQISGIQEEPIARELLDRSSTRKFSFSARIENKDFAN